jgi:glycosyltransferase involved in cell wall biosynthesis
LELPLISIIVPAHNEEDHIDDCLHSLAVAARCEALGGEDVHIWVAADSCTDATVERCLLHAVHVITLRARNVGAARATAARAALRAGARWLAFTDADSVVAPDWLAKQLALNSDAVCGTVTVRDWSCCDEAVRQQHLATYRDVEGHRHVHGANLGVSAHAYRRAGGFPPLATHEDVALVEALEANGSSIAWSATPRVRTSARRDFRAPGGFGAALLRQSEITSATPVAA